MKDKQIGRRQLMQYSAAGIALAASEKARAEESIQSSKRLYKNETKKTDVVFKLT